MKKYHTHLIALLYSASVVSGIVTNVQHSLAQVWESGSTLQCTSIHAFATATINSDKQVLLAATDKGIFLSSNSGTSWEKSSLTVSVNALTITSNGIIFAGTQNGIYFSDIKCTSWTPALQDETITSLTCCPVSGKVFAGTKKGTVMLSTNNGTTWKKVADLKSEGATFVAMYPATGRVIIAHGNNTYFSDNIGASWQQLGELHSNVLAISAVNDGEVFVGTENGMFRNNYNTQWEKIQKPDGKIYSIAHNSLGTHIVGAHNGIWISTDNGKNWNTETLNEHNEPIKAVMVSKRGERFLAATDNGHLMSKSEADEPESQLFIQNRMPELTATNAKLFLQLEQSSTLEIRLFDSNGNAISKSIRKHLPEGCAILDVPMAMPDNNEIVCCVKSNGKTIMRTFHK
jgi:ligand-binding sensor domain-containing protein